MAKNSKWGAVAYLSQSKYGKYGNASYIGTNKQVMINNCDDYYTGVGADTQNASESKITCTTNTYETSKGQAASTTGNITVVYDMSGGAFEYVMGVYNKIVGNSGINFSSIDAKYYDNYMTTNSSYDDVILSATACDNGICYGHALSETAGWYNDTTNFVNSSYSWFMRGGTARYTNYAGFFNFSREQGTPKGNVSFRIIFFEV